MKRVKRNDSYYVELLRTQSNQRFLCFDEKCGITEAVQFKIYINTHITLHPSDVDS